MTSGPHPSDGGQPVLGHRADEAGRRGQPEQEASTDPRSLKKEAIRIEQEDLTICRNIGKWGATLIPEGATVLTHCNAGGLATAGYGTALGVIRAAHEAGKKIQVFADETRPWLQGARLTAWELMKDGIPATLISDNMAGFFMSRGEITCCVVGADRIAANGDTANKIGTYSVAVLAKENNIPFYVAAPVSTLDLTLCRRQQDPDRRAPGQRSDPHQGDCHCTGRGPGPQPVVRCDTGPLHHRHHHRKRHRQG